MRKTLSSLAEMLMVLLSCCNKENTEMIVEQTARVVILSQAVKIHQLVGDFDRERQEATLNQTGARYGLLATDLGVPFQHNGKTYVLFGDSFGGAFIADDAIGYTTDTNPEDGIALDFIHYPNGNYRPIRIPATSTPIPRRGRICLAKPHVEAIHSWGSPSFRLMRMEVPRTATENGMRGLPLKIRTERITGIPARITSSHRILRIVIKETPKRTPKNAVIPHLTQ